MYGQNGKKLEKWKKCNFLVADALFHVKTFGFMYKKKAIHFILLGVVCLCTFFVNNDILYPDIMESRNLVTAREIIQDGNWLVPTMNGKLRLEKPPLPTWIAAGIEMWAPDHLGIQRAMAGWMGTGMVIFICLLGVYLTGEVFYGLASALILCTCFNFILMGRTASWDIYCHTFMLGAIYALVRGVRTPKKGWGWFALAGIGAGLSFLSKGPVSFYALLLPFLIAYFLVFPGSLSGKGFPVLGMVIITIVLSGCWPCYLYIHHQNELLAAWSQETTAWMEKNVRPWYYYWKFFTESGVWSFFLVTALAWIYWKNKIRLKKEYLFSVTWVFLVLFCLSLMPEKKTRYLLPILIPSALTIAHLFLHWREAVRSGNFLSWDCRLFRINGFLVAAVAALLPVGIYFILIPLGMPVGRWLAIALGILGISFWLFRSVRKNEIQKFLWGVVFLFAFAELFLLPDMLRLFNNPEMNSISAVRNIEELEQIPFYYPQQEGLRIEIVYEAGKKILPYSFTSGHLPDLPFALVSEAPAENILPAVIQPSLTLRKIGTYDNNRRPEGTRWYSSHFIHHVTWVEKREHKKSVPEDAFIE